MPDRLTKQDVYLPVAKNIEFELQRQGRGIYFMEQLPGVYPLTGKELAELLTEYEYSLHGNSISFLKEKGVEI